MINGKTEVVDYNWTTGSRKQSSEAWTGRTIFHFKEIKNYKMTNASKRGLLQRLRHAVHLHDVEQVLMAAREP